MKAHAWAGPVGDKRRTQARAACNGATPNGSQARDGSLCCSNLARPVRKERRGLARAASEDCFIVKRHAPKNASRYVNWQEQQVPGLLHIDSGFGHCAKEPRAGVNVNPSPGRAQAATRPSPSEIRHDQYTVKQKNTGGQGTRSEPRAAARVQGGLRPEA